jgi:hypothetical protein
MSRFLGLRKALLRKYIFLQKYEDLQIIYVNNCNYQLPESVFSDLIILGGRLQPTHEVPHQL